MLYLDTHRAFEKDMQVPAEYQAYLQKWKGQIENEYLLSDEEKMKAFVRYMQDEVKGEMLKSVETSSGTEEEKNELKNRVAKEEMLWAVKKGKVELFPAEKAQEMTSEALLDYRFISPTLKTRCSNPAEVKKMAQEQELLHVVRNLTDSGYSVASAELKENQLGLQVLPPKEPACEVHVDLEKANEPLIYIFVKDGKEEAVPEAHLAERGEGTLKPDASRYQANAHEVLMHSSIEMSSQSSDPSYDQAKKALFVTSMSGFLARRRGEERADESAETARMSMMAPLEKNRIINVTAAKNAVAARMARQSLTQETLQQHALQRQEEAKRIAQTQRTVQKEKPRPSQSPQKQLAKKVGVGVGTAVGLITGLFGSSFGIIHITSLQ